ncbi:DsbA family protein [Gordonia sp. DT219]|uniref:DsbA family protein n=1 Tax=Gordonia sp. DT219 TaxID=3416658 RepID=UPI003CF03DEE
MTERRKTSNASRPKPSAASARHPDGTSGHRPRSTSSTGTYVLIGVAVVVVAALVVLGFVWNANKKNLGPVNDTVLNENAALIVGEPAATTTIDVFEDFLCPVCQQFEKQSGQAIVDAVNTGKLRVRYHMLTFLNSRSASGDYSERAAGALQCVGDAKDPALFFRFHSALFADQPKENGDSDHSNAQLAQIAAAQGATPPTQQCITTGAKLAEAKQAAAQSRTQLEKAMDTTAVGTPTVLLNGEPVDGITNGPAWLAAILTKQTQ